MSSESILGIFITSFVGLVSIFVTLYLAIRANASQNRTRQLISRITGLFAASQKVGIETAYENRGIALMSHNDRGGNYASFVSRFETERKLIVIGSSMLGLRMYVQHLHEILRSRVTRGYETKFMLTHPCFSSLREDQEGRSEGQIRKEIEETLRLLVDCGLDVKNYVRFYRGTPTCFLVITSEAMLVNPYPYQIEAFRSFCIEVRRLPQKKIHGDKISETSSISLPPQVDSKRFHKEFKELMDRDEEKQYNYSMDIGPDIYGQFYWYHYLLPWFSRQAVTYEDYYKTCNECPCLETGYSKEHCALLLKEKEETVHKNRS